MIQFIFMQSFVLSQGLFVILCTGSLLADGSRAGRVIDRVLESRHERVEGVDGAEVEASAVLISTRPPAEGTFWKESNNLIEFQFDKKAPIPAQGQLTIREMLDGGGFGQDLFPEFTFESASFERLTFRDGSGVMINRRWYEIKSNAWSNVAPFTIHVLVQAGDANGDGLVLPNDISFINASYVLTVPCTCRCDINGDCRVFPNDMLVAWNYVPSLRIPKPSGH